MITKEKPVQTCDMGRHKVHETLIKLIPISIDCVYILIPICIKNAKKYTYKKFPEREELLKYYAKNPKQSRTGKMLHRNNCVIYYTKSHKCTV
jgi:hypothetical protein